MPNEMSATECAERLTQIQTDMCIHCETEDLDICRKCKKNLAMRYAAAVMHQLAAGEIVERSVTCGECEAHGRCFMEDSFIFVKLQKEKQYCGIGKRKVQK